MEDDFEKIRQNLLLAQELRKKYTPNGNLPQIYFHHQEMGTLFMNKNLKVKNYEVTGTKSPPL